MLMGVERIPIWNLPSLCLTQLAHPNLPLKHICTDNRNKYSFRFDPAIGSAAFPTWLMKIWCASNIYSRPKEGSKYWLVDIQQFAKYWCTKKENTCCTSETDGLRGERSLSNAQTSLLETVEAKVEKSFYNKTFLAGIRVMTAARSSVHWGAGSLPNT